MRDRPDSGWIHVRLVGWFKGPIFPEWGRPFSKDHEHGCSTSLPLDCSRHCWVGWRAFLLLRLHAYPRDSSIVRHVDQTFIEMGGLNSTYSGATTPKWKSNSLPFTEVDMASLRHRGAIRDCWVRRQGKPNGPEVIWAFFERQRPRSSPSSREKENIK